MGIKISSKRYSCRMGYWGFNRFRDEAAKQLGTVVYNHCLVSLPKNYWLMSNKERDEFYRIYNEKPETMIQNGEFDEDIANFIYQPNFKGKINKKQAKKIYQLIKECDDSLSYGYSGHSDCTTMKDMKEIFSDNSKIEWR